MFRGYLNEEKRYRKCFAGGWYLTGDLAKRDEDGYFWFVGRGNDVIKSSGHLIGPFEVESCLVSHPAVLEAGVVGREDSDQLVKPRAYVVLQPGQVGSEALAQELKEFVKDKLAPYKYPRWVEFVYSLPKNDRGKIDRRKLKATDYLLRSRS